MKRLHTQRLSCLVYCQVPFLRQNEVQGLSTFIAQDLLYSASNSRKRVSKLVQLGLSVKQKTRSIKAIIWLNHYGYCISYDEINATETKLAEEQVHMPTARRYIPNNIHPGLPVTFVHDNCDHNSESIYNVRVHGTNGIVIQMKNNNNRKSNNKNIPPTRSTSNVKSIKRRYFKPVLQEVRPFIKPKKRPNPKFIQNVNNDINLLDGCISKCEDLYRNILRYKNSHNQTIPAWKGFFHEVSLAVDDEYIVDYIPMIRSSPRIMETVKEVLVLCKEKAT